MTQIPRLLGARWAQESGQRPTLPFYFVPSDGLLSPRSGQPVTFTRAGRALGLARDGRLFEVPNHMPATIMLDLDGDGIRETASLLMNYSGQHYGRNVNDLSAGTWSITGTGTKTLAGTHGAVQMWRLLDSDAGAIVTLVGAVDSSAMSDGQLLTFGFITAKGTSAPTNPSRVRVRDVTASADRGSVTWTWSGTTPTFTPGTNTTLLTKSNGYYLGTDSGGRRLYLCVCAFTATTLVKANTHQYEAVVSTTAADTGKDVYLGCLFGPVGGSSGWPFLNRGTAGVGPFEERWSIPWDATPRAMTLYARYMMLADPAFQHGVMSISGTSGSFQMVHGQVALQVGVPSVNSASGGPAGLKIGDHIEMLGTVGADGAVTASLRANNGTLYVGSTSAALALPTLWQVGGGAKLEFYTLFSPSAAIYGAAVAWGAQTMDYMASFF